MRSYSIEMLFAFGFACVFSHTLLTLSSFTDFCLKLCRPHAQNAPGACGVRRDGWFFRSRKRCNQSILCRRPSDVHWLLHKAEALEGRRLWKPQKHYQSPSTHLQQFHHYGKWFNRLTTFTCTFLFNCVRCKTTDIKRDKTNCLKRVSAIYICNYYIDCALLFNLNIF